ncbi:MAG TPA: 2OG-Fe(II) oxygenase [Casimicrobiaceae bacterium]|nr:2OG-Fe(II) oxygenase [Casimicrobiaceae bacterium]
MLPQLLSIAGAARLAFPAGIIGDAPQEDFICHPIAFPGALDATECAAIVELGESGNAIAAGLTRPEEGYRKGITKAIPLTERSRWLYERMAGLIVSVNQWYRYEVTGFVDSLLYCVYPEHGQFDWHIDCSEGATSTRKIAISVQLSDACDYDGGGLEFAAHGELRDARRLGTAVSFPAFLHHRVAPVTRGTRRSLVAWAHGPVFR